MFSRCRKILVLALISALGAIPALAKKKETGFLDRTVSVKSVAYKYQVFVPENWDAKKRWPVILFLHGAGERGDDGLIQTEVGIGTAIRRDRSRFPAIVVLPQSRKDAWWGEPLMNEVAIAALNAASKEFHGDPQHTYLTGLSMGGYGTFAIAAQYHHKFAAFAPICGGILMPDKARAQSPDDTAPYVKAARNIGPSAPVWIFHGSDDPVVPVTESQRMRDALKAAGADVRYTEYPGVGHDSWNKAYAEPELISWMLSKSLARAEDATIQSSNKK